MNADALLYEYAVLRYVPRIEREEFVNVGLMMMCKRRRWLRTAVALDAGRIRAFDPEADLEALDRQLAMFSASSTALAGHTAEERFRWFSAVKSSVIQTSRPHPGLTECAGGESPESRLDSEFERLFRALVL